MQNNNTKNNTDAKNVSQNKLPDIKTDFAAWYQEIVYRSELADQAPVRGCMVIRPYGYALWEEIHKVLDAKIKATGHQNAAFPLLIPLSFLQKEAEHVEGFAPELAIVTHAGGKELEEPLVVRPTSETIIHYMFARWMKSWRDLPLKINQWASVVRWEMRARPFLRTSEFWWQEGHTAHETEEEALLEARTMLLEYVDLIENYLAIPVIAGTKSESEKFAGATKTFTMEGMMQDGKALQMGTSHMISQSFAKAFDMTFQDREGKMAYPFLTSWGVTTRLIGAMIMTHGDEKGLNKKKKIAPIQIVIIPIFKANVPGSRESILFAIDLLAKGLREKYRIHIDADEHTTPGAKFYAWELKGIPLRIEMGQRDIDNKVAVVTNRVTGVKDVVPLQNVTMVIAETLENIQTKLFEGARERRSRLWHKREKLVEFAADLEEKGGFYQTGWCRKTACEAQLKMHKATTRCVLEEKTCTTCFNCDDASKSDVLIARAY